MKLYEVPRNTRVRLAPLEDKVLVNIPPGSSLPTNEFVYHHTDGAYSYCTTDEGHVVHPAAWTEVEIVP